jgi:hypothetical protein
MALEVAGVDEEAPAIMACRSSEVPWGVRGAEEPSLNPVTEGVLRCLLRYDADRGRIAGRDPDCKDPRRLTSGEVEAEEAGDRWEGGV